MSVELQANGVAEDMERIFRPVAGRRASSVPSRKAAAPDRRRRASRLLLLGVPALVVAAGASLGLDAIGGEPAAKVTTARAATATVRPVAIPSAAPAADETFAEQVAPDVPGPDVGTRNVEPPVVLRSASLPDETPQHFRPLRPPLARVVQAQPDQEPPVAAQAESPAPVRSARRLREVATPVADCPDGSPEDRCIYQDVLSADRRLRVAYERARQEGVEKLVLSVVGRHWREARERAEDDPDGTIRRYDYLASRLDDFSRDRPQ